MAEPSPRIMPWIDWEGEHTHLGQPSLGLKDLIARLV
jgi:hypothetical protein